MKQLITHIHKASLDISLNLIFYRILMLSSCRYSVYSFRRRETEARTMGGNILSLPELQVIADNVAARSHVSLIHVLMSPFQSFIKKIRGNSYQKIYIENYQTFRSFR